MVVAVLQALHGPVELLQVELEPVQAVVEGEVEFALFAPVVHEDGLLAGVLGEQQGAVVASELEVTLDSIGALGGVVDEAPALVQIVPVDFAVALRVLRRLALEAQLARHDDVLTDVALRARFVVQRPDQGGELLALVGASLGQRLERLEGEGAGTHGRHSRGAVMRQGDGVENALDNPQLLHLQQVDAGRAPPVALG
ncbi:hypothetical protein D3C85_1008600 [compost metagenome]